MAQEYISLLLATVISGTCLSATMLGFWFTSRRHTFKLTWALGVFALVAHVVAYTVYATNPHPVIGGLVVALLPVGLAVLYGAGHQFFDEPAPIRKAGIASLLSLCLAVPPVAMGYDGIAFIVQNFAAAILLAISGLVYFRHRAVAPTALNIMSSMHLLAALSFLSCGLVLLAEARWVIGGVPDNWAERLNVVVAVLCMTGAGALFISLDHMRTAERHRSEAVTDPLTGLLNRRGLEQAFEGRSFGPFAAVVVFDLDHFKKVNDTWGHAAGDAVLRRFADILDDARDGRDVAARLGGEEFALVMPRVLPDQAAAAARSICARFGLARFKAEGGFTCTVSAGIGLGADPKRTLAVMLEQADGALYSAKRSGRNRVEVDRLAS